MKQVKWMDGWKFWKDGDAFGLVWNIPENAGEVTIPHDAMIEEEADPQSLNGNNTGFRNGGSYTYVHFLQVEESEREKRFCLKFEGVYMNAFVYVNGQFAGKCPQGYSTFYISLNPFLKYGSENEIRVKVYAGAMPNSRWYSGAGIYRDVYLLEAGKTYLPDEGVQVTTLSVDDDFALLQVQTELQNDEIYPKNVVVETTLLDADNRIAGFEKTKLQMMPQEDRKIVQRIGVDRPHLWSDIEPNLYTVKTMLYEENSDILDEHSTRTGIRLLQVDARNGLRVNGEQVNLRGACIHHDSGLLGAATYKDAQFRQIKRLKEAGFNAVRMSHHTAAPVLLEACDELGMYVMDEFSDMWHRLKSDYDYGLYFDEWWEKDIEAMVRKNYNHPSVILYSLGNEIPEIGTPQGAKTCQMLSDAIHKLDNSRFTLSSINGIFASGDAVGEIVADLQADGKVEGNVNQFMTMMDSHLDQIVVHKAISKRLEWACAGTDIAGYNYMTARYENDGKEYPNRVIVGSETYPPEIARNWSEVERLPYVIGDFTWTGWDYIGEAGVGIPAYRWGEGGFGAAYPAQLAYCGDIDLIGWRRPASYYREIVFGLRKTPYIAVQNPHHYGEHLIKTPWVISDATASWNWKGCEGKPVVVEIYAPGEEVELFVNDVSAGRKKSGKESNFRILFETVYQPGSLRAVVYEQGKQVSEQVLRTAEDDRHLVITAESDIRGEQLCYIPIEVHDRNGVLAADDNRRIAVTVSDDSCVLGLGTGNPKPLQSYQGRETNLYGGRAMLILKKTFDSLTVRVSADGLEECEFVLGEMHEE